MRRTTGKQLRHTPQSVGHDNQQELLKKQTNQARRVRTFYDEKAEDAALDRALMAKSFRDFVPSAFAVVEPGQPYSHNWHIDSIADHLQAVAMGQIARLVINIPPGHMKSVQACVLWPAWVWAADDSKRMMFSSYSEDFALRDGMRTKDLVLSEWFQERWPIHLRSDMSGKGEFWTRRGGFRIATGTGGGVTGKHAHIQLADDPIKALDSHSKAKREEAIRFWDETLSLRLLPEGNARVILMQRLHQEDLTGHVLRQGGYVHLCLPEAYESKRACVTVLPFADPRKEEGELLWPARFPQKSHDQRKRELGSFGAAGQLQQRPAPPEGGVFKKVWWKFFTPDMLPPDCFIFDTWDLTFDDGATNDFVCGLKFAVHTSDEHGTRFFILKRRCKRMDIIATMASMQELAKDEKHPAVRVIVENKANGPAAIKLLKKHITGLRAVEPYGDKLIRAHVASPPVEDGRVYLPINEPWTEEFTGELGDFPNASNDDQVDAFSQGVIWWDASRYEFVGGINMGKAERAVVALRF